MAISVSLTTASQEATVDNVSLTSNARAPGHPVLRHLQEIGALQETIAPSSQMVEEVGLMRVRPLHGECLQPNGTQEACPTGVPQLPAAEPRTLPPVSLPLEGPEVSPAPSSPTALVGSGSPRHTGTHLPKLKRCACSSLVKQMSAAVGVLEWGWMQSPWLPLHPASLPPSSRQRVLP